MLSATFYDNKGLAGLGHLSPVPELCTLPVVPPRPMPTLLQDSKSMFCSSPKLCLCFFGRQGQERVLSI